VGGFTHVVGVVPGVECVVAHIIPPLKIMSAYLADEGVAHIIIRVEHEAPVIHTVPAGVTAAASFTHVFVNTAIALIHRTSKHYFVSTMLTLRQGFTELLTSTP